MKRLVRDSILVVLGSTMTACATSPQRVAYVYPTRGQGVEQVSRDQAECQVWAKQQTSFDPAMDTAKGAGVGAAVGALGGAAAGAAVGAATGNAGKGAAIGAVAGGLGGAGVGAAVGYAKSKEGYDNAYAACMSAHGYAAAAQGMEHQTAGPPPPPPVVVAPPSVIMQAPPQLVVVPGTPVYYAPRVDFNYFVYGGRNYVFHNGAWFYATAHSGPWTYIALEHVPQPVLAVPVQYYKVPTGHGKSGWCPPGLAKQGRC
jgi:hypothetical protein